MVVSSIEPKVVANRLLDAVRSEGLETAVQAALDLTHYRWLHAENPRGWESFSSGVNTGKLFWGANGELDSEMGDRLAHRSQQALVAAFDVIPTDHPQNEDLRQFLHLVFEELLSLRRSGLGRAGNVHSTDDDVAQLMSELVGNGAKLLDPACGLGTSLMLSAKRTPRTRIAGFDINERIAKTAEARFELAGISAEIRSSDWLAESTREKWDSVCLEPPFSLTLSEKQLHENPQFGLRGVAKSDMVWLLRVQDVLEKSGKAVVLLPASTLTSERDAPFRLEALGWVEAIVSLPSGASLGTSIETCLWIMNNQSHPDREPEVLMVNGTQLMSGDAADRARERAQIVESVLTWRDEGSAPGGASWRSKPVSTYDLRAKGRFAPSEWLERAPEVIEVRPSPPVRLLSELRLASFKAVDEPITVPLRPLTLVYGRNSAGKSSLIQALLMMRQSINASRLVTAGEGFDLGNFRGLVHKHQTSRPMSMGVSFGSSPALDSVLRTPTPILLRSVDLVFEQTKSGAARTQSVIVKLDQDDFQFTRNSYEDDAEFALASTDAVRLVELATSAAITYPPVKASTQQHQRVRRGLARLGAASVPLPAVGSVPGPLALVDFTPVHQGTTRAGIEEGALRRGTNLTSAVTSELAELLRRTVYLGPLRQPPRRISSRSDRGSVEVDLPFFLLDNTSEREEVSAWMQRLGLDYDLDVLSLSTAPGAHVLGDIASIVLTNERTGVTLSTADVGFGVSQVLPILVEMSARRESVILIEQPEIHLHPAMQSELADLMIESIDEAGRGNQIIAETHSEHIMLRVQRRIREKQLDPLSVSVVYVDQRDNGSAHIRELRLDDKGDFVDEWPHGFFAERFDEVFSGLL